MAIEEKQSSVSKGTKFPSGPFSARMNSAADQPAVVAVEEADQPHPRVLTAVHDLFRVHWHLPFAGPPILRRRPLFVLPRPEEEAGASLVEYILSVRMARIRSTRPAGTN